MIKEVSIKCKADLEKFYKSIPLYKSLFYKNITFKMDKDKYDIQSIITALNIKNRKKRITYIYDEACRKIDNHYKNRNICGFKNNKCYVQQKLNNGNINGCCRYCLYQSSVGCKTSNLTCKLFTCSEVEKRCKTVKYEEIKILKLLNYRQRLIAKTNYFTKRETFINDLYINSFVLWELKQLIRLIYTFIKIRSKKTLFK